MENACLSCPPRVRSEFPHCMDRLSPFQRAHRSLGFQLPAESRSHLHHCCANKPTKASPVPSTCAPDTNNTSATGPCCAASSLPRLPLRVSPNPTPTSRLFSTWFSLLKQTHFHLTSYPQLYHRCISPFAVKPTDALTLLRYGHIILEILNHLYD